MASIILKKIQAQDLDYLLENLKEQKKLLAQYNKSKNKKYIILDNNFHGYLFKISGLESFWKIIAEYNFDFDRLRHISASSKIRSIESTNESLSYR